jgi:hypothetical protein
MNARELLLELYDPADDTLGQAKMDDTRRPRLTMLHLSKLRRARDAEKYEKAQHLEFLPDMYGASEQDESGGMGSMPSIGGM